MSDDGLTGKLSRWSQRKLAARGRAAPVALDAAEDVAEINLEPAAQPPEQDAKLTVPSDPADTAAPADAENAPAEDALQLPSIDELDANSDYTQFLVKGVPDAIKHAALRKLWLSDPVFANLDGLNDYDLNYRVIDKLISAADTAYKAGRGYLEADETEADADTDQVAQAGGESGAAERQPAPAETADSDQASEPADTGDAAETDEAVEKAAAPEKITDKKYAALQNTAGDEKGGQSRSPAMPDDPADPPVKPGSDPDPSLIS